MQQISTLIILPGLKVSEEGKHFENHTIETVGCSMVGVKYGESI